MGVTFSKDKMTDMLEDYYKKLYNTESSKTETLPRWITSSWNSKVLDKFKRIDGLLVRSIIDKFNLGKTCAEDN